MSREQLHTSTKRGDKVADAVTKALGSWRFIILQSVTLTLWIVLNSVAWVHHWDGAPFILLNLCLSFQAAFTGPIVLLSQNRQSAKDHARDDLESVEVQQLTESHGLLVAMNKQQLEILQTLHGLPEDQEQRLQALEQKLDEVLTRRVRRRAYDTARVAASTNHALAPGDYQLLHLPLEGDGI
jgi:uncharacterized membrane protein